jgi:hypothetical protein
MNERQTTPKTVAHGPTNGRCQEESKGHGHKIEEEEEMQERFDAVYGSVRLSRRLWALTQTPEFSRLGALRQVPCAAKEFPRMSHTRAEHSIGVAHLTGLLGRALIGGLGWEGSARDPLLFRMQAAALFHDAGHGPFSHTFDHVVAGISPTHATDHEARSCAIVERVARRETRLMSSDDARWICWMIDPARRPMPEGAPAFAGEVVCNQRHGIDTDNTDYKLRDSAAGAGFRDGVLEAISRCRVVSGGSWAFDAADAACVEELCRMRERLHETIYNHPRCMEREMAIRDALGEVHRAIDLVAASRDVEALLRLTDDIEAWGGVTIDDETWEYVGLTEARGESDGESDSEARRRHHPPPPYVSIHGVGMTDGGGDASIPMRLYSSGRAPHASLRRVVLHRGGVAVPPEASPWNAIVAPPHCRDYLHVLRRKR